MPMQIEPEKVLKRQTASFTGTLGNIFTDRWAILIRSLWSLCKSVCQELLKTYNALNTYNALKTYNALYTYNTLYT